MEDIFKMDIKSLIKCKQDWIEKKTLFGLDNPEKMKQYEIEHHIKKVKYFMKNIKRKYQ